MKDTYKLQHPVSGEYVAATKEKFLGTSGGAANDSLRGFGATSQATQYIACDGTRFVLHCNGGTPRATTPDGAEWAYKSRSAYAMPTENFVTDFPKDAGKWVKSEA